MSVIIKVPKNKIMVGHKVEINPTENQKEIIDRLIELYRFVYNWTLSTEQEQYERYKNKESEIKFLNKFELYQLFSDYRNNINWLKDIPRNTATHAINDAVQAYEMFFKNKCKFPRFKSKKDKNQGFCTNNIKSYFVRDMFRIEGLERGDKIKTTYCTPYKQQKHNPKMYDIRIHRNKYGKYKLTFCTVEDKPSELICPKSEVIGIDLGATLHNTVVLSNDKRYNRPDDTGITKRINKLRSRVKQKTNLYIRKKTNSDEKDIKKSKSLIKDEKALTKSLNKRTNRNKNFIQNVAKEIVQTNPECIVLEDLKIKNIAKVHRIAKETSKFALYGFRTQIEWNCKKYNVPLEILPNDFPSSQICSVCGNRKKPTSRKYICNNCGNCMDRDDNAARVMVQYHYGLHHDYKPLILDS